MDLTFFLDGDIVGSFVLPANGSLGYEYNVPLYVNDSLASGPHDFVLQNGHIGGEKALVILDSIVVR